MPWTMFDDAFPDHPKLVGLTLEQIGFWVLGVNYANRFLTDGHIPTDALASIHPRTTMRKKQAIAAVLVTKGLWDETPTGWQVHDFHDFQKSAETVRSERAKRAEAGRLGGRRSGQVRRSKAEASASQSVRSKPEATGLNPIPSLPTKELSPVDNQRGTRCRPLPKLICQRCGQDISAIGIFEGPDGPLGCDHQGTEHRPADAPA